MTKVEELRDKLCDQVEDWVERICAEFCGYTKEEQDSCDKEIFDAKADIDSLIAAAKEEERERIRGGSQMVGVEKYGVNFVGGVDYVGSAFLVPVNVMDPPVSVLAPKEEK